MDMLSKFAPNAKVKTLPVNQGDLWADSPFFAPGMEEDGEHILAMKPGSVVAGIFRALRRTKNDVAKKQRDYACLETLEGERFRIYAPGQLRYTLENTAIGSYITIGYKGREHVEKLDADVHAFDIEVGQLEGNLKN